MSIKHNLRNISVFRDVREVYADLINGKTVKINIPDEADFDAEVMKLQDICRRNIIKKVSENSAVLNKREERKTKLESAVKNYGYLLSLVASNKLSYAEGLERSGLSAKVFSNYYGGYKRMIGLKTGHRSGVTIIAASESETLFFHSIWEVCRRFGIPNYTFQKGKGTKENPVIVGEYKLYRGA